jgi:hypothetical protein
MVTERIRKIDKCYCGGGWEELGDIRNADKRIGSKMCKRNIDLFTVLPHKVVKTLPIAAS